MIVVFNVAADASAVTTTQEAMSYTIHMLENAVIID